MWSVITVTRFVLLIPGKLVVEDPLPTIARVNGIQCSTAHITVADNTLLFTLSHQNGDFGDSEWILYTGSGYLLHQGRGHFRCCG